MNADKLRKEYDRTHAMLEWLAKRYVRDVPCRKCPARMSCNQQKMRTVCATLIIEAAELAVSKAGEQK